MNLKKINHAHDWKVFSIKFEFDAINLEKKQKLIIICGNPQYEEYNNEYNLVGYDYYNIIFINPSNFFINIKTQENELTLKDMINIQNYLGDSVYIEQIQEVKKATNLKLVRIESHTHWKIDLIYNNYISVYADDLKIEKID